MGYVGSFQHLLFNRVSPRLFPGEGMVPAVKCALFDNFVHSPFLYLPAYYSYQSFTSHGASGGSRITLEYQHYNGKSCRLFTLRFY